MCFYIEYKTKEEALEKSEQAAIYHNCTGDITKYWYPVITHPALEKFAIALPDDMSTLKDEGFSDDEINSARTRKIMQDDGWFNLID